MYVFVFESLKKEDIKTGLNISNALNKEKIPCQFMAFGSWQELSMLLDAAEEKIAQEKLIPFIHLDCHGNKEGIFAINEKDEKEFIPWKTIRDKLIPIYKSSEKRSVICISSCEGFTATSMIATGSPCPYHYIVGSLRKIPPRKSFEAFKSFYLEISKGSTIWDTAVRINHTRIFKELEFMAINRDTSWNLLEQGYLKDISDPNFLKLRKSELIKKLAMPVEKMNSRQKALLETAFTEDWQKNKLKQFKEIFYS